jgi:microfibrillar-associated protein 1
VINLNFDRKLQKYIEKGKKKWKFMQKYYHKGAFYIDDTSIRVRDDVRKRDTSEATLDDKFNKEMLPKVLQVRNFGKAGR